MLRKWKLLLVTMVLALILCACAAPTPSPDPAPDPKPDPEVLVPAEEITPDKLPDPMGFLQQEYPEHPVLSTVEETASYMLYNLLQGNRDMEFYLDRSMGDDWDGYCLLDDAQESAKTYNLFGAYTIDTMVAEEREDEEGLVARFKIKYIHDDYDKKARIAAVDYVRDNPPPAGGFTDFEQEKEYARGIHDFLARKVTYDPIGYDQEVMNVTFDYDALQEAYNVLGPDQDTAVCAGYARAFALIAQYAGINAVWVQGNYDEDGGSHAWNVLYPCDGSEPVTVDVTWDDTESDDEPGQVEVSDGWFYFPVRDDGGHTIEERMLKFLNYINAPATIEVPEILPDAVG